MKSVGVDVVPFINDSVFEYTRKKAASKDSYSKLESMSKVGLTAGAFKYVEVLKTFSLATSDVDYYPTPSDDAAYAVQYLLPEAECTARLCIASDLRRFVSEGLHKQRLGSNMVSSLSDPFALSSAQLLYMVSACYASVQLYTPMLATNAECMVYVVATNLTTTLNFEHVGSPPYDFGLPQFFLTKLSEIITMIGQKNFDNFRTSASTCDYECFIWTSKFLRRVRNGVNHDPNGRADHVEQAAKTSDRQTVD
jgi:hypothetical protein